MDSTAPTTHRLVVSGVGRWVGGEWVGCCNESSRRRPSQLGRQGLLMLWFELKEEGQDVQQSCLGHS